MRAYLPVIAKPHGFDVTAQIAEFVTLMRDDPQQQRERVMPHPVLMQVAQARAEDLVQRDYMAHVDPDGLGPNWHVREGGYALPDWYSQDPNANNIESIGGGYPAAINFWTAISTSPRHRDHALGLISFYAQQKQIGVGCAYRDGSRHSPAWVLLSTP